MTTFAAESATAESMLVHHEAEQWLFHEAHLLDERKFNDWFELVSQDIRYYMPIRENALDRDIRPQTEGGLDLTLFDDDYAFLRQRVRRMYTGMNWCEEPAPRTRRFVTNVVLESTLGASQLRVRSNFLIMRNRLHDDRDSFAGQRTDTLVRQPDGGLLLHDRRILLDQSVILSKSFSVFF